jgi:hypothetical protein
MGTCGSQKKNEQNKYLIKSKRKKKYKDKNKDKNKKESFEEINFEIIDTLHAKTTQVLLINSATLSELLTLADFNVRGDLDIQLKDTTKINNELNTNLKDIIENYYPGQTLLTITILVTNNGLSIPSNIQKAYQDLSPIIGNAIFNDPKKFIITLFYKENQNFEFFSFDKNLNQEVAKFNSFSSFCSAKGVFYISGGENEEQVDIKKSTEEYCDFVSINMNKINSYNLYLETLPDLVVKRTWHSMIFVPKQYIFIVGGLNTKTVEIYDIDKNEIYLDSELKERRCEPTMCLVNNIYLYAFCGFSPFHDFIDNIERCNLLKKKREWEYIEYSNKLNPSFFGVSYFKDNEILLISSKDNLDDNNKNYRVRIEKEEDSPDVIKEIILQYSETRTFKDKLFYPFYDNISINSPLIIGDNKTILLLNMDTGAIECKNYK